MSEPILVFQLCGELSDFLFLLALLLLPGDPSGFVLLDCRLQDSSDLEFVAHVRRLRPDSAVVMMTAYGTPEVTRGALDLGVHRVVNKPFDMQVLESLVLEAHRSRLDHA